MSSNHLIPEVESRIFSWWEIQKKIRKEKIEDFHRPAITISREFGCPGFQLAAVLQNKLETTTKEDWTVFDKALIDKMSKDHLISAHLLENLGERAKYLDYVIAALLPGWKSEEETYKSITKTIYAVAKQGNAVIVGQGAFAVTKNLNNCFHFRLIAPTDYKIRSYAKSRNISDKQSEQIIQEKQQQRDNFMKSFYNCDYRGNEFHLTIDCSKFEIEKIADIIILSIDSTL